MQCSHMQEQSGCAWGVFGGLLSRVGGRLWNVQNHLRFAAVAELGRGVEGVWVLACEQ